MLVAGCNSVLLWVEFDGHRVHFSLEAGLKHSTVLSSFDTCLFYQLMLGTTDGTKSLKEPKQKKFTGLTSTHKDSCLSAIEAILFFSTVTFKVQIIKVYNSFEQNLTVQN